jgi:prepilin-type processing-associated H-X9-DG protein
MVYLPPVDQGRAGFYKAELGDVPNSFMCSEDKWKLTDPAPGSATGVIWDAYVSHGFNGMLANQRKQRPTRVYLADIANPSDTVLSADTRDNTGPNRWAGYLGAAWASSQIAPTVWPRHRYGTQCMVLWVDGHASPVQADGPWDYTSLYTATRLGQTTYDPTTDSFSNPTITSMWDTK